MSEKKTPLYDEHIGLGGKMVNYAGWLLPIQYEGLVPEHKAVRNAAGIFDVSHMGTISIEGADAQGFLDYLMTNDISKAKEKQILYSFMTYPDGGVVEDLLVYKYRKDKFLLVVNAANLEKDLEWIEEHRKDFKVEINDISHDTSILALQGPKAQEILQGLTDTNLSDINFFYFMDNIKINGVSVLISRTGYTGEDGFEIYVHRDDTIKLWQDILTHGKDKGLLPTGLGSRDTLRFEASLPLYGQELSAEISPLEAGFKFFVKLDKDSDFIGKTQLSKQWEEGPTRSLVGFELLDRGIPREGYEVQKDGLKIGYVTTGYISPSLNKSIGNALITSSEKETGNEIDIVIRKRAVKAKIINRNFLKNK